MAATARACGGRFTPEATAPAELLSLVRLALLAGDDARAQAAAARWVTLADSADGPVDAPAEGAAAQQGTAGPAASTPPDAATRTLRRAGRLVELVLEYLKAVPMRLPAAEALLPALDTLGPAVTCQRFLVYDMILAHAVQRHDMARMERLVDAMLPLQAARTHWGAAEQARCEYQTRVYTRRGYDATYDFYSYAPSGSPLAVLAAATAAESLGAPRAAFAAVLARARRTGYQPTPLDTGAFATFERNTTPAPMPPLQVPYYFPAPGTHAGSAGGAAGWPVPGKVSLYVNFLGGYENVGAEFRLGALIRRLVRRYGDSLAIVALTQTKGYFFDSPPLAPAAEAAEVRKYFQEFLGLPVAVAVDEAPVTTLPNGRRQRGASPLEAMWQYSAQLGIVDAAGRVVLLNWYYPEAALQRVIELAMTRTRQARP